MSFLKQKRVKYKPKQATSNSENEDVRSEIEKIEKTILAFQAATLPVPEEMSKELGKLKAKLSPNKVNAHRTVFNGIEYDSAREARMARHLTEASIPFQTQVEVELLEAFELEKEKVRPIHIVVDFLINNEWFVDVKGIELQPFPIKWKMLKNKFRDSKKYFKINKDSQIEEFIRIVKATTWKDTLSL